MKINVHAGHNFKVQGASGCFSETKEDRNVKNLVITKLRALGHEVYDCTDEDGTTQAKNLSNIVNKCNAHTVDLDVSIHFNAYNGTAHGTEVYYYCEKGKAYAEKIVNLIAKLGFTNRGAKKSTSLYVLKKTKATAVLVECCFCDNQTDANMYNAEKMASAIVEGITGKTVVAAQPTPQAATPKPAGRATGTYEVTASDLSVRKGPGTNYRRLKHGELTENAKAHDKDKDGCLDKGTPVTVKEWRDNWARIPSGWVCGDYLKKV